MNFKLICIIILNSLVAYYSVVPKITAAAVIVVVAAISYLKYEYVQTQRATSWYYSFVRNLTQVHSQHATSWYSFVRNPTQVAMNPIEYILIRAGAFVIVCSFFSLLIYVPPVPTPTMPPTPIKVPSEVPPVPTPTMPPTPIKVPSEVPPVPTPTMPPTPIKVPSEVPPVPTPTMPPTPIKVPSEVPPVPTPTMPPTPIKVPSEVPPVPTPTMPPTPIKVPSEVPPVPTPTMPPTPIKVPSEVPPVPTPTMPPTPIKVPSEVPPVPTPTMPPTPIKVPSEGTHHNQKSIENLNEKDFCKNNECCNDQWLIEDLSGLENELNEKVFGQHLANKIVSEAVKSHIKNKDPKSPLVMSFHGKTGTGKTFVSHIVANSLFKKGIESKFFQCKVPAIHFKNNNLKECKDELIKHIQYNSEQCYRMLFVFDEFDFMPVGLSDVMTPYLDYHAAVDGRDYRKNIFIFLSNVAGDMISNYIVRHYKSNRSRESIVSKDLEKYIANIALNSKGGFNDSKIFKKKLVNVYVPFLPLEKKHVKQCAEAEMKNNNYSFKKSTLEAIADDLYYFPDETPSFSVQGCKTVAGKVNQLQRE
ncbi:torsin-3A-like isoform X2 [Hydra vulgaris]|uniref:Torsin-3A-like isoform X2 n=1 Tax=Hydra vulgaris TaxID=6087 RepID=A0ABM4C7D3_HYDVU